MPGTRRRLSPSDLTAPRRRRGAVIVLGMILLAAGTGFGQEVEKLRSDSRSPYIHRITLYDEEGAAIDPSDPSASPYSPIATCGKCHEVGSVSQGWHFNAGREAVDPGRPGEPWFWVDSSLGVEFPLSARDWPGAYSPEDVGVSAWEFAKRFGRHAPGGGLIDPTPEARAESPHDARWMISGELQPDCMICHDAGHAHDPAERERQIEHEKFKWIPAASLGVAIVRGQASNLPDDWDPLPGFNPDFPDQTPPALVHDPARFDANDRVFFNVTRKPSPDRCYFCHATRQVGADAPRTWETDGDVHVAAGLACVECHRNGIDHAITRGYEGEPVSRASAATLTCRGCHLGVTREEASSTPDAFDSTPFDAVRKNSSLSNDPSRSFPQAGRLGAPYPEHKGLPALHLERMSCTACHSGPYPAPFARRFQTSMAHALGNASKHRADDDPPAIFGPIFARRDGGPITPYRAVWPAFWGIRHADSIQPLDLNQVRKTLARVPAFSEGGHAVRRDLDDERIAAGLRALTDALQPEGKIVYARRGLMYELDAQGQAVASEGKSDNQGAEEMEALEPYLWPIAHDVRPASQSLGIKGCFECHADDAPIQAGRWVDEPTSALPSSSRLEKTMSELRGEDPALIQAWNRSFRLRPLFKGLAFAGVTALGLVLSASAISGTQRLLRRFR